MTTVVEYAKQRGVPTTAIFRTMRKYDDPVSRHQELDSTQLEYLQSLTKEQLMGMEDSMKKPIKQEVYGSRNADKFVIRLPEGLRTRIQKISNDCHRSMNSQMIVWLEKCVELHENCEEGEVSLDALKEALEVADPQDSVIVPFVQPNYAPAPGTPVRVKNGGGVWKIRNYTVRTDTVIAILETFTDERNEPALLDVGLDQLEPV